jgi:site-specific recombinase XerD
MRSDGTFKEGKITYTEAEIVPHFLRFCELKGLSRATISIYKEKLDRFFRFLQGKTPVTSHDLMEFIGWLRERQPAPESLNIHLRSLKTFFRWAVEQNYLKKNPMHGVPMVRQRQKLITPLTISEL